MKSSRRELSIDTVIHRAVGSDCSRQNPKGTYRFGQGDHSKEVNDAGKVSANVTTVLPDS